ncbi:hypothetical protein OB955_15940 [Halobacteria archaeon AArc-m2/3/4]|uniref:Uncharacterized protein n=1 Tax=Natronoglomus mannanivorans TaxID=2979990 RepID=A0AAP2Z261_9EURY|nr:hypothetical protein [Halobacteria archaeon AArc-xg1-1]MCU4974218.1 hypothetical protein [Halobacteria archaeon AArc-m2/3/4]
MHVSHATDRTIAPYNTAYLRDDRTHLYEEYDIDRARDSGAVCPETGERDAPHDVSARREAILSFYGHRCGRCLSPIVATSVDADAELGYVYSLADAGGTDDGDRDDGRDRWALENLVAVCESCYEVCSIEDPDRLDVFESAYQDAQQFPQWLGDPRVAVERIPLSGRELWVREQLATRSGDLPSVDPEPRSNSKSVNERVAETACLARETPAKTAISFGEQLAADAWQPMPTEQRLTERWEALEDCDRASYERRAADWRTLVESSFVPARR